MESRSTGVVVVGGGVAGMTAANALSAMGLDVVIVEQKASLGGHAAAWACMAAEECARCSACVTQEQVRQVGLSPRIGVLAGGEVTAVQGTAGSFEVHVEPSGAEPELHSVRPDWQCRGPVDLRCGRILLASGFEPYDASASTLLSYGRLDEVFTTRDVDNVLRRDALEELLPAAIEAPRVAFLQCVGSRDRARGRNFCAEDKAIGEGVDGAIGYCRGCRQDVGRQVDGWRIFCGVFGAVDQAAMAHCSAVKLITVFFDERLKIGYELFARTFGFAGQSDGEAALSGPDGGRPGEIGAVR